MTSELDRRVEDIGRRMVAAIKKDGPPFLETKEIKAITAPIAAENRIQDGS